MTNQYSYFFYGKTYDELIDYVPSFIIPIIIPDILMDEGIKLDIGENGEENRVDLALDNCYDYILPIYKQVLQIVKKNDSDIKCFNLFLKMLNIFMYKRGLIVLSMNSSGDLLSLSDPMHSRLLS